MRRGGDRRFDRGIREDPVRRGMDEKNRTGPENFFSDRIEDLRRKALIFGARGKFMFFVFRFRFLSREGAVRGTLKGDVTRWGVRRRRRRRGRVGVGRLFVRRQVGRGDTAIEQWERDGNWGR